MSRPLAATHSRTRPDRPPLAFFSLLAPRHAPVAVGAVAIGALAIGSLAIKRLSVRRSHFDRLEIDELVVRRLQVEEAVVAKRYVLPEDHPGRKSSNEDRPTARDSDGEKRSDSFCEVAGTPKLMVECSGWKPALNFCRRRSKLL